MGGVWGLARRMVPPGCGSNSWGLSHRRGHSSGPWEGLVQVGCDA